MRMTFILDRLNLGGAERHCLNLSRAMAARGHQVQIIVLLRDGSAQFPTADFPVPPVLLCAGNILSPRLHLRLGRALRLFAPDSVMAVNQTALVAAWIARTCGAPMGQLWCRFATTVIATRGGRMKLPLFKYCVARADGLIFVSPRQAAYWHARGLAARQVVTIPNGIAVERFAPPCPNLRQNLRKKLSIQETDVSFTLVGRLAAEKNHLSLMRALSALRVSHPQKAALIKLVFIGEGPMMAILQDQAVALGVTTQVIFTGGQQDVLPYLAQADCGVLVSQAVETFSHAALEMMATGLPMIMTEIGGAADMISDGVEGCLVPVNDNPALQRALLAMMDQDRRHRMGASARRRVLCAFTDQRMFDAYEAALTGSPLPVDTSCHLQAVAP